MRSGMPTPQHHSPQSLEQQIAQRVEQLLARHALLRQQVAQLTRERDTLQARLRASRARNAELLQRLNGTAQSSGD